MKKSFKSRLKGNMTPSKWVFFLSTCAVVFAIYILFCVVPILQSVKMSFYDWAGYRRKTPIGWKNYSEILADPVFWKAFKNDLIITLIKEIIICFLTVLFAVTLTRLKMKRGEVVFYKFVFYVPNILSVVIIGMLWKFIFMSGSSGLLNAMISVFKKDFNADWITQYPLISIGFVASWCGVGLFMLTMIASINQIPGELYEAARIDGASEMKQLQYITMPAVWLQLTFMVVSILYQSLGGNFALVNVFAPTGGFENGAMVMGLYVYRYGTGSAGYASRVGYSYAAALVMLVLTSTISLGVKYFMDKAGEKL